ncbi:MAG: methylenetetrahydrofolate reductase [NAD(P)H] [Planctomycetes bacterium]|nr:methylenetetrahydrofolate reductase [NAD(P)H] [Planctomycetota bacterium]
MRIRDIYKTGTFGLSFEIFPPKTPEGDGLLWENVSRLAAFQPKFISCTYGAGGSTRTRTLDLCQEIKRRFGIGVTAHFTCLGGSLAELRDWLTSAGQHGIDNIMALRGDPPAGQTEFHRVTGGLEHANDLVTLIHNEYPHFGIGVAGYPEKHPEAPSLEVDLANLQRKVAAGGEAVYTQVFFDNERFLRFRDRCDQLGIRVPLVPGIMPILNYAQIKRITSMCGASLPTTLSSRLEAVQDDKEAQARIGIEFAIEQCRDLIARGVPGIHYYVLNRSQACEAILQALGPTS